MGTSTTDRPGHEQTRLFRRAVGNDAFASFEAATGITQFATVAS